MENQHRKSQVIVNQTKQSFSKENDMPVSNDDIIDNNAMSDLTEQINKAILEQRSKLLDNIAKAMGITGVDDAPDLIGIETIELSSGVNE